MHKTSKFTSFREFFSIADPMEVYTWGNNRNFTLGHGGQQGKHHPELVDLFPRNGVYIKQVFLMSYIGTFLGRPWRGVWGGTSIEDGTRFWKFAWEKRIVSVGFLLFVFSVLFPPPIFLFFLAISQQAVSVNLASSLEQLRSFRVGLLAPQ